MQACLSFVVEFSHFNESLKAHDHLSIIQTIWRMIILPLLAPNNSHQLLKAAHSFIFGCLRLPHVFHSYFMMNDFLIFRKEEVYFILKKVMESTQRLVLQFKDENVSHAMQGLWFDCTVLLPSFKAPATAEHGKDEPETVQEQRDPLFNKVLYVFKREVSESTVKDHQNSLIYNNRDNSMISEFFFRLSNLVCSLDEVCLAEIVTRMDKFQEETFACLFTTALKLLQVLSNDAKKVFRFLNIQFKLREECLDLFPPKSLLLHGLEFAFNAILGDRGISACNLQATIVDKIKMPFDPRFSSFVEGFEYHTSSEALDSLARVKTLSYSHLSLDSNLYEASIQERHIDFIRQNLLLIVDSNCMVRNQEFLSLLSYLCSYFRLHQGVTSFLSFLVPFHHLGRIQKELQTAQRT